MGSSETMVVKSVVGLVAARLPENKIADRNEVSSNLPRKRRGNTAAIQVKLGVANRCFRVVYVCLSCLILGNALI